MNRSLTTDDYHQLPDGKWRLRESLKIEPISASFDGADVAYLAADFDPNQLENEIKRAEIKEGVARMFAEDAEVICWRELGKACSEALEVHQARQPKPRDGKFSVQAVKAAYDIVDIIGRYTKLRKAGKEYQGKCPLHGGDTGSSLRVSQEKQLYYCFACHRSGDLINFIMEIEGLDTRGACRFLACEETRGKCL